MSTIQQRHQQISCFYAFLVILMCLCRLSNAQYGFNGYPFLSNFGSFGNGYGSYGFGSSLYTGYGSLYPNYNYYTNYYPYYGYYQNYGGYGGGYVGYPGYGFPSYYNNGGFNTQIASSSSGFASASASSGVGGYFGR